MDRKCSPEMRERALRMLAETRTSHPTLTSAVRHVAGLLGMSPETLRLWRRRYEVDAGARPGLVTDSLTSHPACSRWRQDDSRNYRPLDRGQRKSARAGLPTIVAPRGTSCVTTQPAPIVAPPPIVRDASVRPTMMAPAPIVTPSSMDIRDSEPTQVEADIVTLCQMVTLLPIDTFG